MPRKKEEDTLIEDNNISFMVYFKGFFLLAMVFIGMFFVNNWSTREKIQEQKPVQSASHTALVSLKNTAGTYVEEQLKKEGLYKSLEKASGQVMGEATKAADMAIDKSTETIADYVYEHTIEVLVVSLIEKIPDRQKKLFLNRLCENYECK